MDLAAIRQALADVVTGAMAGSGHCYAHPVRSPVAPCAVIDLAGGEIIDYNRAFGSNASRSGLLKVSLKIVFVATLGDDEGTARISSWLSTGVSSSVPDAVRTNKTLGGLIDDLDVPRAENAVWLEIPPGSQNWFSSAELAVDIYLPRGSNP